MKLSGFFGRHLCGFIFRHAGWFGSLRLRGSRSTIISCVPSPHVSVCPHAATPPPFDSLVQWARAFSSDVTFWPIGEKAWEEWTFHPIRRSHRWKQSRTSPALRHTLACLFPWQKNHQLQNPSFCPFPFRPKSLAIFYTSPSLPVSKADLALFQLSLFPIAHRGFFTGSLDIKRRISISFSPHPSSSFLSANLFVSLEDINRPKEAV